MAVKVRLMRIGAKGRPFYRVVAVDERRKRTGSYLELLGTYNPLTTPKEINLKQDRIDAWVKNGAQLSSGFLRIIGKAPRKPERKAKKDKGNSSSASTPVAAAVDEKPAAETEVPAEVVEQAPVETTEPTTEAAPEATETPVVEETTETKVEEEKAE